MNRMREYQEKLLNFLDTVRTSRLYLYIQQNITIILIDCITLVVYIVFWTLSIFDTSTFWAAFVPVLINIPIIAISNNAMSDKIRIMGLSVDYMLNKGGVTIDDILGILISNKVKKRVVEPTRVFFRALNEFCDEGNYEQRRRVAEALPALYRLDKKNTKLMIEEKLRDDFDENKWHDDNRRRTIEALFYFPKRENQFIKKCMHIRRKDSIFTIIAIFELVFFTNKFKEDERNEILNNLRTEISTFNFENEVTIFINEAEILVKNIPQDRKDILSIYNYFKSNFNETQNLYIKILLAKNILYICPFNKKCIANNKCQDTITCANCILDFFNICFQEDNHRYVRRPMAKENIFNCLLSMLKYTVCRSEARDRILSLIKQEDAIISLTVFDYIHKLFEIDKNLYNDVLNYCLSLPEEDKWKNLKERAIHVKETIGMP